MFLTRQFFLAFLIALSSSLYASSVTGTVSLDPATQIYTYSYTLTNSQSSNYGVINQFYVAVNSIGSSRVPFISSTTPAGWEFSEGWCCTANGASEVQWYLPTPAIYSQYPGLPEGQSLGGFSFQTMVAPGNWVGSNSEWYYPDARVVERAQVVAPDYLIPNPPPIVPASVPEPASTGLIALTIPVFLFVGRARQTIRRSKAIAALKD